MGLNSGAVRAFPGADFLMRPQVPHLRPNAGRIAEMVVVDGDACRRRAPIEQKDGAAAASKRLDPHFLVTVLCDAMTLHAKPVLINGNHVLVSKDRAGALVLVG